MGTIRPQMSLDSVIWNNVKRKKYQVYKIQSKLALANIHVLSKYLLSMYYVQDMVLGAGAKTDMTLVLKNL